MANKKVYFAGSIRGGRVDAELYHRIISYIQRTDVVLTEHVGKGNLNLMEQGRERDARIYDQDTAWLRESDVLIGECTCPSLGVGYELAYAEAHGIPCHIFYDSTKTQLSAMLTGDPYFHIHPYITEADIYPQLDQILNP
ncbi:MAG: nucleoside 2-deoxyribosyltransferase [Muribaculaceae bacterium]|nr:nucleoside 2-deoxyribosyltransferase [Muribaculaceae bacterium]